MTIVFYSNFINHHQIGVADELYRLTNGNYHFVCMESMPQAFIKNGYPDYSDRPYIINMFESDGYAEAFELAKTADVAIFDADIPEFLKARLSKDLMTFQCGERWLKKGLFNLLSPRLLSFQFRYHTQYKKSKHYYALNVSAYAANDFKLMKSFIGKCYKWAYFTKVDDFDVNAKTFTGKKIMWCNRFIWWKHPEMPVLMAKKLKDEGYDFVLDMYGGGKLFDKIRKMIAKLNLEDVVHLKGTASNAIIKEAMKCHDILLTTSDRNEGWGATVNEGMSCGCVVIGSNEVGSVPFLIEDGANGLIFESKNISSLVEKIKLVLGNPELCQIIASKAYTTMWQEWNPQKASENLMVLSKNLFLGKYNPISVGPCSKSDFFSLKIE